MRSNTSGGLRPLRVQPQAHPLVFGKRLLAWARQEGLGCPTCFQPAQPFEHGGGAFNVDVGSRARKDELGGMRWMAKRVVERDEPSERAPEDDRVLDTERRAERNDVIGPGVEVPLVGAAAVASPVPTVVVVDDLGHLFQRREDWLLERSVVETGPAVEHHECRPFTHGVPLRNEGGPIDINEQRHLAYRNAHLRTLLLAVRGVPVRASCAPVRATFRRIRAVLSGERLSARRALNGSVAWKTAWIQRSQPSQGGSLSG